MSTPQRFRKKPVVIEAMQYTPNAIEELNEWLKGVEDDRGNPAMFGPVMGLIPTPEGVMEVHFGDWVIKGVAGEFYPCKPDIFEATHEAVEGAP